jgi:hypothetical protein
VASLGSFGAARREQQPDSERDTFEFCGETYTVTGTIPAVLELEISAGLAGKIGSIASNSAQLEALQLALTGKDGDTAQWHRFRRAAIDNGVDGDELSRLTLTLCGWQLGVPTEQSSTSSDGRLLTGPSSNGSASGSPASPTSESAEPDSAG